MKADTRMKAEENKELNETYIYIKEIERLRELLKVYAGCNVCIHHEDFNKCNEGGKCGGSKWEC